MGGRSLCPFIRSLVRKEGRKEGRIVLRYQHSGEEDEERRRRRLIMGTPRGNTVYGKVLIDMHSHHIILCGTIQADALSANVVAGSSDRKKGGRVGLFKGWKACSAAAARLCLPRSSVQQVMPASQPANGGTTTWPSFRTATLWTTLFIFTCGKEIICWWSSEFSICLKIVRASFPKKALAYPIFTVHIQSKKSE